MFCLFVNPAVSFLSLDLYLDMDIIVHLILITTPSHLPPPLPLLLTNEQTELHKLYNTLYKTVQYYVQYCTILCTILYYTMYNTVQYYVQYCTILCTILYNTMYNTVQYYVQYCSCVQYNILKCIISLPYL